jgi:uncharacterized membrane protein
MAIHETIEIGRPPQEVFAYLDDLTRHHEWQPQIVDVQVETPGPTRVGTRVKQTRRVPGGKRTFTMEALEHDPPNAFAFKVIDGPIRPHGRVTLTPLEGGSRTRYTFDFEIEGHGLGKLVAPLVRRDAARQIPENLRLLKERLESEQPGA